MTTSIALASNYTSLVQEELSAAYYYCQGSIGLQFSLCI